MPGKWMMPTIALAVAALLTADVAGAAAQRPAEESRALADVRLSGSPHRAVAILAQTVSAQPAELMLALSDSLVRIAASFRENDSIDSRRAAVAAVTAFGLAGSERAGIPYAAALCRLVSIVEQSPSDGIRAAALSSMTQLVPQEPVIRFLRATAMSPDLLATVAVGLLARETGPAGVAVLRQLHAERAVVNNEARENLSAIARYHGW
jgi:hypothetical protein